MTVFVSIRKYTKNWKPILKEICFSTLNINLNDNDIKKNEFGKPFSEKCFFSISHSKDLLAIAVSKEIDVGVDIQKNELKRDTEKFAKRICSSSELKSLPTKPNKSELIKLWTKKEALFKLLGNIKTFNPKQLETKDYYFNTIEKECENDKYFMSIATKNQTNFNFI